MSQRFGEYELLQRLGAGGMGEVFLARRAGAEEPVVLKRVLPRLAAQPGFHERFLHEARVVARLNHPNVVRVLELGDVGGQWFLAMEHVAGVDLSSLLAQGPLPPAAALHVAHEALAALEAAHGARDASGRGTPVIHRDVSPHNLLVSPRGAVKLIDFGVASLTGAGESGGKLGYAAPEQLLEDETGPRTDVYSVGVVLWEALVGKSAFDAEEDVEVIRLVTEVGVPALPASTPAALRELVARLTALEPAARFQSAAEAREAVRQVQRALRLGAGDEALGEAVRSRSVTAPTGTPAHVPGGTTEPVAQATLEARLIATSVDLDDVELAALEALRPHGEVGAERAEALLDAAALPGGPFSLDVLQALLEKGALSARDEGGERRLRVVAAPPSRPGA